MQYIPARIEGYSMARVKLDKINRSSLRTLDQEQLVKATDFRSLSEFHQEGRKFTLAEAFKAYGPITVEVREGNDVVAMVEYTGEFAVIR